MKMVICFDTDDDKGMENTIKMVDHLATQYKNQRVGTHSEVFFGKIEFIKMIRAFATKIATTQAQGLEADKSLSESTHTRERESWEGLRFAKEFTDKVFDQKRNGKRLGDLHNLS
jgi:hypothetical protein